MSGLEVASPYDQHLIQTLPLVTEAEVQDILNKAHEFFRNRSLWLKPYERIAILDKALQLIKERRESLVLGAVEEGGKPLADSNIEMDRAILSIELAKQQIMQIHGTEIPMRITQASDHRMAYTYHEPIGVVYAISAFNHPINLIVHQAFTAIAAGCPVIIKPSLKTPLTCIKLVDILYQAGLPKPMCQVLVCDDKLAEALISDYRIRYLSFIGSHQVGWYLRSKLSPGAKCILEHGGAAPVIIEPDADLNRIIPGLIKGSFYHAGQVCVSVQRIFVHQKILKTFTKQFVERARTLRVGDPLHEATDVGPLINAQALKRIDTWVQEAMYKGGKLVCGGEAFSESCYAPTVIVDAPSNTMIATQEIFGPVVAIFGYKDYKQAIQQANQVFLQFQASVYTQDIDKAMEIIRLLKANTVLINDHTAFRVDWMPFGGLEQSGLGIGGIPYAIKDMLYEKLMILHSLSIV